MNIATGKRSEMSTDSLMIAKQNIRSYEFSGICVRTVCSDDQIWMVFADVCKALHYVNPTHQVKYIPDEERKKVDILAKNGLVNAINLGGLRRICVLSTADNAMDFLKWAEAKKIFDDYDGRRKSEYPAVHICPDRGTNHDGNTYRHRCDSRLCAGQFGRGDVRSDPRHSEAAGRARGAGCAHRCQVCSCGCEMKGAIL